MTRRTCTAVVATLALFAPASAGAATATPAVTIKDARQATRQTLIPYLVPAFTWRDSPEYRAHVHGCRWTDTGAVRCRFRVVGTDFGFRGTSVSRPVGDGRTLVVAAGVRTIRARLGKPRRSL